jgi:ABC-type transport system involved in multi-copper enzyme maturation permease subunit
VFAGVYGVELFLVCFVAPAFTAAAISSERERQTYDLLRTTLLPARALVFGKLASALSYVLLLIFAAVPLQSMAFLLSGVGWEELTIGFLLLVISAVTFASLGLYISSVARTTLAATGTMSLTAASSMRGALTSTGAEFMPAPPRRR